MSKIKDSLIACWLWLNDVIMFWSLEFWNNVLSFVLNHTKHIYISNIYKMLDSEDKSQMKHYFKVWEKLSEE